MEIQTVTLQKMTAKFFMMALPIAAFSFALAAPMENPCHAQTFIGFGDGTSWNDNNNWTFGNVPTGEDSRATIRSSGSLGFSVQINSPTTVGSVGVSSNEHEGIFRTASLTVNSQLSAGSAGCSGESGFFNVNADVNLGTGGLGIGGGATLNLNSGVLTSQSLSFGASLSSNASPTFNQNGGNFHVENLSINNLVQSGGTTATIGPDDNVTNDLSLTEGSVICDRPLIMNSVGITSEGTLTINHDFTVTRLFSFFALASDTIPPTLVWNDGEITTESLQINDGVINRTGGRLLVENFGLFRTSAIGMDHFTVREDDVISGIFTIDGDPEFPVSAAFEGPHSLEAIDQTRDSSVNYQQDSGESEGLVLGRYSNFGSTLNLGFDSQSAGGLDWVLRVDGDEVNDLEDMIDDGRIVVTGAGFSVEYNAAADVTYIQQATTTVLGDANLDGTVSFGDIPSFISVLSAGVFQAQADCNQDGEVNFADIPAFIEILIGQ